MSATPSNRIVPGAPPPPPGSANKQSHKKKKKATPGVDDTSAAPSPLTATQNLQVVTNGVSNQGTPPVPSTPAAESPSLQKLSPIAELISKRLKIAQKKAKRIKEYNTPEDELNPDQIRSIASLPGLEAVAKELEEVKKSIEAHESECSKEESVKRAAADEAQKAATAQAVAEAKATSKATTRLLLSLARLPAFTQHSQPNLLSPGVTETESSVILSAAEILTGEDSQSKEEIISGFFSEEGELEGVPYSRLIEIAHAVARPHRHPSEGDVTEGAVYDPASGADTGGHGHAGGLLFVHESELDNEPGAPAVADVPPVDEVASNEAEAAPEQQPAEVPEPTQPSGTLDWSAEDEHDLPPISGLQKSFGGEIQPIVDDDHTLPEDDGFTTHGGRGRGHRGERRGGRGGHRAEGRGYGRGSSYGDRGGRGSYRGRGDGEFRGRGDGHRGRGDGEWRGRGDGERRGRGDGEWRGRGDGEWRGRGDGEWRGRGDGFRGRGDGHEGYRGRGRGRGEGRDGPPPHPQQG